MDMKYDFLKNMLNSITSFFDYILIEREFVLFCLLFIMYIRAIKNTIYLWNNSKEEETSRSQVIESIKPVVSTILSFAAIAFFISWDFILLHKFKFNN